ncbi:penicillin-binding protein 1C [Haloferula sp. BvORR071]|uniref:penicillin-binding protein 1C n=1 Tax=Haloferula sp. BvORR071 TaxID=1396141 RepID=UPI000698C845|nr:penicillin-binding protein 1C [Haloferula sp. BvORR071]
MRNIWQTFLTWRRRITYSAAALLLLALLGWIFLPKPELYPEGLGWSRQVRDRHGTLLHLSPAPDGRYRLHASLGEIHPALIRATLQKEDRYYRWHPGVNPIALLRATWGNLTGHSAGGASTLTMQVARLRWQLETRGPGGKLVQMFRALQLERHYTKDQILEAYLNLAPYGGNVEGAGAAALLWCGHPPSDLTEREAFALSVIPQSPATRHPGRPADRARIAAAQARLIATLDPQDPLRQDPLAASFTLEPPGEPPHFAPHFCRRMMYADPADSLATTLDLRLQQTLERGIRERLDRSAEIGINNACAVLVHAPSRQVLAYIGSGDYHDRSIPGMVDGLRAKRSPGSALKPFVYGLALEQGIIHPRSLLVDGPMVFGDYNPENFEREFMGPINAREALLRSRNIPAVDLARRLSGGGLYALMQRGGVQLNHPPSYYGLSLTLGGASVTPLELVTLYASLADDGRYRPLSFQPGPLLAPGPILLDDASRYLVLEMLSGGSDLGPEYGFTSRCPGVSWKTGTSHGFRDAWAVGVQGEYVLLVWMGNFSGRGNNALVARRCAAPLLFDLLARLDLPDQPRPLPPSVVSAEICPQSGCLSGQHCPHRRYSHFISGVSPIRVCDLHREILVDATTGLRVTHDDGRPNLRRECYEFWPPDLLELFRKAGVPRREPPSPENGVASVDGLDPGTAPEITSPLSGRIYLAGDERESIALQAKPAAGVTRLYWFCDEAFLGSTAPSTDFAWLPTCGRRTLRVVDDHGRGASVAITVRSR